MKKKTLMVLALAAGALLNAENAQNTAACSATAGKACELSSEELAFRAKLTEQNLKAFEKFTDQQKKDCLTSAKNGGNPNEAVSKLASSASSHVANAEKANPAKTK